jgi:hypothetical protein
MAETNGSSDERSEAAVRAALTAAGLSVSDEEFAALVASYPGHRARIDALYAIPEARDASPALVFDAAPVFVDWSD